MVEPPFNDVSALRDILGTISDFVIVVDRVGRILFINRVEGGREMADVVGRDAREFMHPETRGAFDAALESVWSSGTAEPYDVAVPNLQGEMAWYRSRVSPLRQQGRTVAAVLVATDVSELKAAERELDLMGRLLPICSWCRRIRSEDGEWQSFEAYLERESGTSVSHGVCHDCAARELG